MTQQIIDPSYQNETTGELNPARTHGFRLATWLHRLSQSFLTSNSGSSAPSIHAVGTLWWDSAEGLLKICTIAATSTVPATWLTINFTATTSSAPTYIRNQYAVETGTASPILATRTLTDNWHGKIVRITEEGAEIRIENDMSSEGYFFISNESGAPIDVLIRKTIGVYSPDATRGDRTIGTTEYECFRIQGRRTYLIKRAQTGESPDVKNIYAKLWVFSEILPIGQDTPGSPMLQPFYILIVGEDGAIPNMTIPESSRIEDSDDNARDASGKEDVSTPEISESGSRIVIISPVQIQGLVNKALGRSELISYNERAMVQLTLADTTDMAEYFTYTSLPLRSGTIFNLTIAFGT